MPSNAPHAQASTPATPSPCRTTPTRLEPLAPSREPRPRPQHATEEQHDDQAPRSLPAVNQTDATCPDCTAAPPGAESCPRPFVFLCYEPLTQSFLPSPLLPLINGLEAMTGRPCLSLSSPINWTPSPLPLPARARSLFSCLPRSHSVVRRRLPS